jgi:hypothetical protein
MEAAVLLLLGLMEDFHRYELQFRRGVMALTNWRERIILSFLFMRNGTEMKK